MHPRLYMHSFQYVTYNPETLTINFETRHVCGRRFHFRLTKNQFLALNDAILLIDREKCYGHYPLGQGIWMYYNCFNATLYKELADYERIYFKFACFDEYKTFTHRRLLSLIRLNDNATTATVARVRERGNGRKSRAQKRSEANSAGHKRQLSIAMRPENQSSTSKRSRRKERDTLPRSSDNVIMSHDNEESPVFSEWHCSNTRRRHDSISTVASSTQNLASPERVRLDSTITNITVESE